MRIRTIAVALVVAAPLLALGSPQAAACWETASYRYSSPAYYGGYSRGIGIRRVGYRSVGWRRGYGVGRVGVGRIGRRR
jgi:hypothetical protein